MRHATVFAPALLAIVLASGCSDDIERDYGRVRGASVNGVGVLAEMIKARGHKTRVASRLSPSLMQWADAIVRFSPRPGPPDIEEASWYGEWLDTAPDQSLVFIPRDFDTEGEYWAAALENLGPKTSQDERKRLEQRLANSQDWVSRVGTPTDKPADAVTWFAVDDKSTQASSIKTLEGPWAEGIDAASAALPVHQGLLTQTYENVLLAGDGKVLAMDWTLDNGGRILVLTNGSFALNASMLNRARRPLAARLVDWIGPAPQNVAFVEGGYVTAEDDGEQGLFHILTIPPFGWIFGQLAALGLAACLFKAPRLGRPRAEPPTGVEQPSAHPRALGRLLARTRQARAARDVLQAYRRWRFPNTPTRPDPS